MLRCTNCSTKNINNANYCKKCGKEFTEEEKKSAKKSLIVRFLEKVDKLKDIISLDFITGNIFFKIFSILVIVAIGIYYIVVNGVNLKLLESDEYKIQFNTKDKEYYLLTQNDQTSLNLYIPNRANEVNVKLYDKDDKIIEEKEIEKGKEIILDNNDDGNYYIIEAEYKNNNLDKIKLFVYKEEKN